MFTLTDKNYDRITTFSDIWTLVLNPKYLELLTDIETGGVVRLKKLDAEGETWNKPTDRYMQVFADEQKDPNNLALFNKFVDKSNSDYNAKVTT